MELNERVSQNREKRFLNRAQLIKPCFGLNKFRSDKADRPNLTLLYIFWEPQNHQEIGECQEHREELNEFQQAGGLDLKLKGIAVVTGGWDWSLNFFLSQDGVEAAVQSHRKPVNPPAWD